MVRKKDELWKHGVELKGRFKCNFCERDFAGGIARLKSHLSGIKGRDINICTKAPADVQEAAFVAIRGSRKKAKTDSNVDNPSLSLPKKLEQSDIMNTSKKNDKNAIDRLLCQLLILNNIPFSVVQTPSFIKFVKGVSEYGVGYELPCCTTLQTTLVSDSKAEVDEYDSDQDNCENELLNLIDKIFPDDTMNEADLSRNCVKETHSSESRSLKLQFSNNLCLPIFSGTQIQGEDYSTLEVALVDCFTGKIVKSGPESSAKVEIVLLKGDIDDDEDDNWTVEEFNNNIERETAGEKPLLAGDTVLNLKDGVGYVGEISFTDKSSWTRSPKLRLGARIVDISDGTRVLEAKTESFIVRDHCGELLCEKHHPPSLSDEVWRLEEIGKDGAFHNRLSQENINTVKDFLTLLYRDPLRLRYILGTGMSAKMWECMVEHARTCVLEKTIYLYRPSNSQQKTGIVFNVVGQLVGLLSEGQIVLIDQLSKTEKADANNMLISAFKNWDEVKSFDDEASLIGSSASTNVLSSSSSSISSWTKYVASHGIGGLNYVPSTASSPDIISPIYFIGETSGSDDFALHTRESNDLLIDHTLNFPGQFNNMLISNDLLIDHTLNYPGQFNNMLISNSEQITQALCSEDHLQIVNSDLDCQNMSLESPANLQTAIDGFLFTRSSSRTLSVGKAQRRWTMLVTVLKWILPRVNLNGTHVEQIRRF